MALQFWHESHVGRYLMELGQIFFTEFFYRVSFLKKFSHFCESHEHTLNRVTFLSHIGPESHRTNVRQWRFWLVLIDFLIFCLFRICRRLLWAIDVTILSHLLWRFMWLFWVTDEKSVVISKFWWSSLTMYTIYY